MIIIINGEAAETRADTLDRLLGELGFARAAVATAVNGRFVARTARGAVALTSGDRVEIVAPREGG